MTRPEIEQANARGVAGERAIGCGLTSDDGRFGYAVEDDVAILIADRAIALKGDTATRTLGAEKESVRAFYDEVGWQKTEDDLFVDTARFVDTRPVVRDYLGKCRLRVNRHLEPKGGVLLDVASGPVQFPEYRTYSNGFDRRICVDLSTVALRAARDSLEDKAVYIQGDLTNLPFRDDAVDAAISLHTIYHVPLEEQATAFRELHRVLKPGGTAVIAYSWGKKTRSRPSRRTAATQPDSGAAEPRLYVYGYDYGWFVSQDWPFRPEILVWRSVSAAFLRRYVHPRLLGRQVVSVLYWLEERFPHLAGRLGQYPLVVIRKA